MTSPLSRIASLAGRRPRATTLTVIAVLVALIAGAVTAGGSFKDDFTVPGIESQKAQDLLEQRFPAQSGTSATLVFTGDKLDKAKIGDALAAIGKQPHVVGVENPFKTPDRLSKDGRTAYTTVSYDQTATDLDSKARERLQNPPAPPPAPGAPAQ